MSDHERRVYLNHIRRLEDGNRILAEMLAQERLQRQNAFDWYRGRLQSRFLWVMDAMLLSAKGRLF